MSLKRDLTCPQCDHRQVWHIETIHERGLAGLLEKSTQPFNVVLRERFFKLYDAVGSFETYICKQCGFTEWYARGLEGLRPDPKDGIHLLDGRTSEKGPFR